MPVVKLSASGALDVSDERSDTLATLIRRAIGKESLVSLSMTGDSSGQWIQMFNPLGQPDLLGWRMFAPMMIQLQKCEKCSREFCSPINYRRHMRVHRRRSRYLNVDKESDKNRDLLGAFWDNLSLEDVNNVVSLDDISLKEVSGSSIVKALGSVIYEPGIWTMPQTYVRAGSILLAKYPKLPISSQELFDILDDTSERTFLCAGTAESVQKFIIDGEAEEAFEMRNLISSVSLLFEQKLVRAWLADKDAVALKCQKLLEEEEEAAEKRRSQLLERRKKKQLRQQKQKAREPLNHEKIDNDADSADRFINSVDGPSVAEISASQVPFDINQDTLTDMNSYLNPAQLSNKDVVEARLDFSSDLVYGSSVQSVDTLIDMENGHPQIMTNGWQVPKSRSQRSGRKGFNGSQDLPAINLESFQKQGLLKDRSAVNSGKVWTRNSEVEIDDESSGNNMEKVETNIDKSNSKLLIGSISVPVRSTSAEKHATQGVANTCSMDSVTSKEDKLPKENLKTDSAPEEIDLTTAKLISICPPENSDLPVQSGNQDSEEIVTSGKVEDNSGVSREICLQSCPTNMDNCGISHLGRNDQLQGRLFSSNTAKAFLAQRWKEAISGDHVRLVLSLAAPENSDRQNDSSSVRVSSSSILKISDLGAAETQLASIETSVAPIDENTRAKSKKKPEKGTTKSKYTL